MAALPAELWLSHVLPHVTVVHRVCSVQYVSYAFRDWTWRSIQELDLTAPEWPGPPFVSFLPTSPVPPSELATYIKSFPFFSKIAHSRVVALHLPQNCFGEHLAVLVDMFPNVQRISFEKDSRIYPLPYLSSAARAEIIESLETSPLNKLTRLEHVTLPSTNSKSLHLERLTSLKTLIFSPAFFSTFSFNSLRECSNLTSLNVGMSPIDLNALPNLTHLRTRWQSEELTSDLLNYTGTSLTSLDLGCFTKLLPCGSNIEKSLRVFTLHDENCVPTEFVEALNLTNFNFRLTSLFFNDSIVAHVIDAVQCWSLASLRIRSEYLDVTSLFLPYVSKFTQIKHLKLCGTNNYDQTKQLISTLPQFVHLEQLELKFATPVNTNCYENFSLANLTRITHLQLSCCPNSHGFLHSLSEATHLTHLSLEVLSEEDDLTPSVSLLSHLFKLEWLQVIFRRFVPHWGMLDYDAPQILVHLEPVNSLTYLEFLHLYKQTKVSLSEARRVFSSIHVVDLSDHDYKFPHKRVSNKALT